MLANVYSARDLDDYRSTAIEMMRVYEHQPQEYDEEEGVDALNSNPSFLVLKMVSPLVRILKMILISPSSDIPAFFSKQGDEALCSTLSPCAVTVSCGVKQSEVVSDFMYLALE
jgi:hypothetical protein